MNNLTFYPKDFSNDKSILFYAEFYKHGDRTFCKVYKRQWFCPLPSEQGLGAWFFQEVHPFVLFEFDLNERTEPRKETVCFMVNAMNEKAETL